MSIQPSAPQNESSFQSRLEIQPALPLLDNTQLSFRGADAASDTLQQSGLLFEPFSQDDSNLDLPRDPPSPLTPLSTPEIPSVELPFVSDDVLPWVDPKTKDFTEGVLGIELSRDAPVIEWPKGFKTVLPFLPTKEDPTKNELALVCY